MKYKILIVEDDSSWQNIIKGKIRSAFKNMNSEDYEIKIIDNFDQAYAVIEEGSWNLLVTDIGLGNSELQPMKLGKQLVEIASEQNIPTIVVSGTTYLNRADVREILKKLGAYDFFAKETFDAKEFIDAVQDVLQNPQQSGGGNLSSNGNYKLSDDDRQYLIKTLSSLAASALISATEYFRNLVAQLSLPPDRRNSIADIWTGDTNADANRLINWIDDRNNYPQNSHKSGYTVLGSLIEILLQETGDKQLLNIIIRNQLITDEKTLKNLEKKYL